MTTSERPTSDAPERIWICHAPAGVVSSGPEVTSDRYVDLWRDRGWNCEAWYRAWNCEVWYRASAPASPAIGIQAVTLDFHAADTTPDVPRGQMKACVIMMRSRHTGKNFTMPAYYLNAYPLEFEDGCGDEKCEDEHDDGCPVTGWFYDNANFEYENCYYRIEGECLAWALIPDAASVEAALHPAPEAASPAAAERERIADELDYEASVTPDVEDAVVVADCARLVRANFSYDEAERISDTAPSPKGVSDGAQDVLAERRRQIEAEGWTPEHDDEHTRGEIAAAAVCYAFTAVKSPHHINNLIWPWPSYWWKPTDKRRNLVKAGALILAEIERLDRAALSQEHAPGRKESQ